jgi:hypothetical protein
MPKTKTYDTLTSAAMKHVLDMAGRYADQVAKDLNDPRYKAITHVQNWIEPQEAQLNRELRKLSKMMEA